MTALKILAVFGTRPEAIKVAPIVLAAADRADVEVIACSSGQHREMLDQVTSYFGITPQLDLQLMTPGQTLTSLTSRCLEAMNRAIEETQPHCVLTQGDTTTAMCGGLVAFYRRLPFIHVEAGLRTDDINSPFPEEMNRRICSLVSTLHCAPTETAADNLRNENHAEQSIVVTGNTVIDALKWAVARERTRETHWLQTHPYLNEKRLVLITAHRRENHGAGIRELCDGIRQLADTFADVQFVYPVHLNPNIQQPVRERLSDVVNIHLIPPADYAEFVWLMDRAELILSDSGGVQEEAPSLGKPVLVCRESTERPEALAAGATRLVGTDPAVVVPAVSELLTDPNAYQAMQVTENPYGDGTSATRILDEAVKRLSPMVVK